LKQENRDSQIIQNRAALLISPRSGPTLCLKGIVHNTFLPFISPCTVSVAGNFIWLTQLKHLRHTERLN